MPIFINETRKVLYVHVPKTGGSSIEVAIGAVAQTLLKASPRPEGLACTPQHLHAKPLKSLFPDPLSIFDAVIVTVRDPVSRFESEYRWQKFYLATSGWKGRFPDFAEWATLALRSYSKSPFIADNHIRPQTEFLMDGAQVFRLEEGGVGLATEACLRALGIDPALCPDELREKSLPHQAVEWTCPLRELFLEFYGTDFEVLGYEPKFDRTVD